MKGLVVCLLVLLALLQVRLWFGEGSVQEVWRLREASRATQAELLRLRGRNQALQAEVRDLKSGLAAIEERARTDLGMIDEGETFYRFVRERRAASGRTPGDDDTSDAASGDDVRVNDVAPLEAIAEPPVLHDLDEPTGGGAIVRGEANAGG